MVISLETVALLGQHLLETVLEINLISFANKIKQIKIRK